MATAFTWDPDKNQANIEKHGVSFELASEIFSDPSLIVLGDIQDNSEERYKAIGITGDLVLLIAIYVDRQEEYGLEIIHIISARKAVKYEQKLYQIQES